MPKFPHYSQHDAMDCGPACLRMIAKYHGKNFTLQTLRDRCYFTREGVSLMGISDAAESIGLRTTGVKITYQQLAEDVVKPCIAHWHQEHFVVVYKTKGDKIVVGDPAGGINTLSKKEFLAGWQSSVEQGEGVGICLLVEPTPDFYANPDEPINKSGLKYLFSYLTPYRKFTYQLIIGLIFGSLLQLIFPFLTQSVVDIGIGTRDISYIYLILLAQMTLIISRTSVDFIRGWILLHLGTRINVSLISDFLLKLMKLPIAFFNTKMTGDLIQRIQDHHRIERFLTTSTLNILFSMLNLIIFGIVLLIYDLQIFLVFLFGSVLYTLYVSAFMKKRKELDHKHFMQLSSNQSNIIQLITGMQEIKLNNCEKQKRWEWEHIQASLFRINVKGLSLDQYQQAGAVLINESKSVIISIMAASEVINGNMTLGMMLAVQYILGQLNSPLEQMIGFFHSTQDAKLSLERLGEIHLKEDEETEDDSKITILPEERNIAIKNLSFQYEGPHSNFALKDIDLEIPGQKITAIVGTSGSGKTTLVKMLLGFYPPQQGEILIGNTNLENVSNKMWRQKCGVVMQDGFIFSDTIAKNVALGEEKVDLEKLRHASQIAHINDFVESLPLGYNTKIGDEGHGLSQGQKQRLLIARAVYKNPELILFDEATNSLDANNELLIMKQLDKFFTGKTVVVVAHRLSTVKNADQIIVLEKGQIIEKGTHSELTAKKGAYYNLVKNQLELGN